MSSCFIMMPFGGQFDSYYRQVLCPAVEASGMQPVRADEIFSSRALMDDVSRAIEGAGICLADVSGRNPNVAYELGMAHALGKPVIMLTQDVEDVPFDYKHLRILTYDPTGHGWEQDLHDSVMRTILEIQRSPEDHRVFTSRSKRLLDKDLSRSRDHLRRIYLASAYDHTRTNYMYCNERGDALIKTSWQVRATTPLYLMFHSLVSDRAGTIEVRRVHDKHAALDLDCVESFRGPRGLDYFMLFKVFKEAGDEFSLSTEVFAEYYFDFDALFENGETMMSSQASDGGIRFLGRRDYIFFPKTPRFAGIVGEYEAHPDKSLVGERVGVVEDGEHYVLRLEYDWGEPHQSATVAKLIAR